MKGEYISIETARIMADIEIENKKLQEENEKLKIKIAKARDYIRMHCEIRRNEEKGYDEIGKVEAMPIYSILED